MKKEIIFALFMFFFIAVKAQIGTRKYFDENGYKGLRLGDTIANILKEKMTFIGNGRYSDLTLYSYKDKDALRITDNIFFKRIIITLYKNKRISAVDLYYNKADTEGIKDFFDKIYGKA